ncbi:MAG TPA: adenylate/guanylate cyclase domain-containing protein [bacterium]|jgi:class 3 adenylate cyclase|nr:adenylate/guanylate cyclase domain-containing protein [bacterium]HXC62813.1 adenylate/guanylate cyclase domain-containing protein [bacterium]
MKLEVLTIVFVDIKDYTSKTSEQSRGANERLLARFASLVKPMVRSFNGVIIKSLGDAYLITFKSPTDSLLCSMACQDQLSQRNRGLAKDERFDVRFAINAGEVRIERKDVFGEAVNIAARIEGLAKGGEIYFSEAVYLMMNKSEVPFEEVGPQKLKGISEAVVVYRVPKLSEVGAYKLALAADTAKDLEEEPGPQKLPYGGLALKKVHTHMTGQAVESDGALYLAGALSEMHYTAASLATQWTKNLWLKLFWPFLYIGFFGLSGSRLLVSPKTYQAGFARLRKMLRLFQQSKSYRRKVLVVLTVLVLALAAGFLGWREYQLGKEAEAYKAQVQEQAREAAMAQARANQAQKALSKEKKKFHFPW